MEIPLILKQEWISVIAGKGLKNAVGIALEDASLSPEDIDYVSSCANSTKGLDRMESGGFKRFFGRACFQNSR